MNERQDCTLPFPMMMGLETQFGQLGQARPWSQGWGSPSRDTETSFTSVWGWGHAWWSPTDEADTQDRECQLLFLSILFFQLHVHEENKVFKRTSIQGDVEERNNLQQR